MYATYCYFSTCGPRTDPQYLVLLLAMKSLETHDVR